MSKPILPAHILALRVSSDTVRRFLNHSQPAKPADQTDCEHLVAVHAKPVSSRLKAAVRHSKSDEAKAHKKLKRAQLRVEAETARRLKREERIKLQEAAKELRRAQLRVEAETARRLKGEERIKLQEAAKAAKELMRAQRRDIRNQRLAAKVLMAANHSALTVSCDLIEKASSSPLSRVFGLSLRQAQLLFLAMHGFKYSDMAPRLNSTKGTLERLAFIVRKKLKAKDIFEAVKIAFASLGLNVVIPNSKLRNRFSLAAFIPQLREVDHDCKSNCIALAATITPLVRVPVNLPVELINNLSSSLNITCMQAEILLCMERSMLQKDIAMRLGTTTPKLRVELNKIFKSLGVRSASEAVIKTLPYIYGKKSETVKYNNLTAQQQRVVQLAMNFKSLREIAECMNIKRSTLDAYVALLFGNLGVNRMMDAVKVCYYPHALN